MRTNITLSWPLALCVLAASPIAAQDWQWMRHIGGQGSDFGRVAAEDEEGNIYVLVGYAGSTPGNPFPITHSDCYVDGDTVLGSGDSFVAKYDPSGELLWLKNCISPAGAIGFADLVIDTTTQSIFIVGSYEVSCVLDTVGLSAGTFCGAFISRWTYDGACVWAHNVATSGTDLFGSRCFMRSLTLAEPDKVVVTGSTTRYTPTYVQGLPYPYGSFLAGYDTDGTALWARPFATQNYPASILTVGVASRGAMVYASTTYGLNAITDTASVDTLILVSGPQNGYFLARINPSTGDFIWYRKDGGNSYGALVRDLLATDEVGRPAVASLFLDTVFFSNDTLISANPSVTSSFIAVHDTTGEVLSVHAFHNSGGVSIEALVEEPAGGFYATGYAYPGIGDWDGVPFEVTNIREIFVSKHDSDGTCLGVFTDGSGPLYCNSILATNNGLYLGVRFSTDIANGVVTLGDSTFTTYGYQDVVLAKLDLITGIGSFRGAEDNTLHIYANPNNGLCTVDLPQSLRATDGLVLRIFDQTGHLVQQAPLEFTEQGLKLDVRAQAKGIYHVELTDGQQRYSGRIVFE